MVMIICDMFLLFLPLDMVKVAGELVEVVMVNN